MDAVADAARDAAQPMDAGDEDGGFEDASVPDVGVPVISACRAPEGTLPDQQVAHVGLGGSVTCAVYASGAVRCLGTNTEGQLGDGLASHMSCPSQSDCSLTAVQVAEIRDGLDLEVGNTSCVRRPFGVSCWGLGSQGALGDGVASHDRCGSFDCSRVPVTVAGLGAVIQLEVSDYGHACARLESGKVACWGANADAQLGDGLMSHETCDWAGGYECSRAPVEVADLSDAVELTVGGFHACARRPNGHLVCWGHNVFGQLGDGSTADQYRPVEVLGISDAVEVEAGYCHTCAKRANGEVLCWGWDTYGQVGAAASDSCGGYACALSPQVVRGLADVVDLSSRHTHTCALHSTGRVSCWGNNQYGELGDGLTSHEACANGDCSRAPVEVAGLNDVAEIEAGGFSTCAVRSNCEVWCWGNNPGHLGDGTTTSHGLPARATAF